MKILFYIILFTISGVFFYQVSLFKDILAQGLENTYVNEKCGMSINYPKDWKVEESDFVFEDKSKTLADINTQEGDIFSLSIGIENMDSAKKING